MRTAEREKESEASYAFCMMDSLVLSLCYPTPPTHRKMFNAQACTHINTHRHTVSHQETKHSVILFNLLHVNIT